MQFLPKGTKDWYKNDEYLFRIDQIPKYRYVVETIRM